MTSLTPRLDKLDKNYIINGNFDHWQRGTSFVGAGAIYTADRMFCSYSTGTTNYTRSTDVPDSQSSYSLQIANTSGTNPQVNQFVESVFAKDLANKTVTFKVKIKVTDATGTPIKLRLSYPNVIDNFSSITPISTTVLNAAPTTNVWATYTLVASLPANVINGLEVKIFRDSGVTVTTTTTLYSQMQVILGSNSDTDFNYAARNVVEELSLCQRYYETRSFIVNSGYYAQFAAANVFYGSFYQFLVEKRAVPTVTAIHNTAAWQWTILGLTAFSANDITGTVIEANTKSWRLYQPRVAGGSSPTSGNMYQLEAAFSINANAEL